MAAQRLRLNQGMVGATDKGVTWSKDKGDEIEVADRAEAERLIERGIASPIEGKAPKRN